MYNYLQRTPRNLILGEVYTVMMWGRKLTTCQFIQPTEKGYNFLDLETSKCILKHHIYPWKKASNDHTFFVHYSIIIHKNPPKADVI